MHAPEPRRVLLCATGFPRHDHDDHKPFLLDHARALQAAGLEVTVLCPAAPGLPTRHRVGGVEVVRFRYGPRRLEFLAYDGAMYRRVRGAAGLWLPVFVACFAAAAVRLARQRRVEVVHGHWWAPCGLVALVAARASGAVSVVHLHGSDAVIARGPVRVVARWVLRRAGAVLAASDELARWARQLSGRAVSVVPMPLSVDRLPVPCEPPADGPVVGVGRLLPEKGFDVLVRAAALTGDDVVVVGDGPARAELAALAHRLGVHLALPGPVEPAEVGAWYQRARVVAVPSLREGFGMVAAEAAYCGRAVVGSRVGGLPMVVEHGVSGLLVPPGQVEALADALRRVDPAMGRHGRSRVRWLEPAAHAEAVRRAYRAAAGR
jgi:glycosyltransferase involved in cell wall biosynthesis